MQNGSTWYIQNFCFVCVQAADELAQTLHQNEAVFLCPDSLTKILASMFQN